MIEGDRRSTLSNDRLSVVGLGVCRRNRLVLLPEPPCRDCERVITGKDILIQGKPLVL